MNVASTRWIPDSSGQTFEDKLTELCSWAEVSEAIQRLADDITEILADSNPLALVMMQGGLVFAGQLLPLLRFPLQQDFLHLSRYGHDTSGGEVDWVSHGSVEVQGRSILLLDDIYDQGFSLQQARDRLLSAGAASVTSAVLVAKNHTREKSPCQPDFVGLHCPDAFLVGAGMDYRGYGRNLAGIYALDPSAS